MDNIEDKIIQAAREVFVEKGFENTSMGDIADRVGIRRTNINYYFRTKEKLFEAIFKSVIDSFLPKVQQIIYSDLSFIEKLDKIIDEYVDILISNRDLPKFIIKEIFRDVNNIIHFVRLITREKDNNFISFMRQDFITGIEKGELKNIPMEILITNFYSLLIFPFITRDLLEQVFFDSDEQRFVSFVNDWKKNISSQMRNLLIP